MNLSSLIKIEFMKQKRGFLWKIVFIIPVVACLLFSTYVYIRYNQITSPDLLKQYKDFGANTQFDILLFINHQGSLWFMLSSIVFILIAIKMNHEEYSENCWKLLLSLPVTREKVYLSKWIVIFIFSSISIIFNSILFTSVIFLFKLGDGFSVISLLKYVFFQILCSLSIISFQHFISNCFKNLLVSLSIAFIGIINTIMFWQSSILSNIIPYMPTLRAVPLGNGSDALTAVISSIISGILWLVLGLMIFSKKDIC